MTSTGRDASLDAARGCLMMLGIVLHSASIYAVNGNWLIVGRERSYAFDLLVGAIHVFRMPAFFFVSGYFFALALSKMSAREVAIQRMQRLLVPLLFSFATLNVLQVIHSDVYHGRWWLQRLSTGQVPVYHLWFLVDLIVFTATLLVLMPILKRVRWFDSVPVPTPFGLLLGLSGFSFLTVALARLTPFAYDSVAGLATLFDLATYGPYFAGGALLFVRRDWLVIFLQTPIYFSIAAVPLAVFIHQSLDSLSRWQAEGMLAFCQVLVWVSIAGVLRLFRKFFFKATSFTTFLAEASYTIFLFHHLLVAVVGVMLMPFDMPAGINFALCVVIVFASTALIHLLLVGRFDVFSLLFNGKRTLKAVTRSRAANSRETRREMLPDRSTPP
ncbi:acyltransferase family protein [Roseateles toxinivorans]|nr:acyltransferase family protein [Roseateles toxinivorans]